MKPSYRYARNVIVFLFMVFAVCSLLALLVKPIRAMLNLPEQQIRIDNANPLFVELTLIPTDFSNEYHWYYQSLTGYASGSTSMLVGYYNYRKITVHQSISKYEQIPFRSEESGIHFIGKPGAFNNVYDLQKAGVADFLKTECLFNLDDTIICRIDISKSNIVFDVEINYGKPGDIEGMESILNSVLNAIADKFKSI